MKKNTARFLSMLICFILISFLSTTSMAKGYKNIQNTNEIPKEANIQIDDIKNVDTLGNLPTKEITISYEAEDESEIFGKMNDQEIQKTIEELIDILNSDEFLQKIVKAKNKLQETDILENAKNKIQSQNILNVDPKADFSKISISVVDSSWSYDPDYSNENNELESFKNQEPLGIDTKPFSDSLDYYVPAIFANSKYNIIARGSIFIPTNSPTIERATGKHISGEYGGNGNPLVFGKYKMQTVFTFRSGGLIKNNSANFYINSAGKIRKN